MNLSLELLELVGKLAREQGLAPEAYIEKLVRHDDSERHVSFKPGVGPVRTRCLLKDCFEKAPKPSGDLRD